MTTLIQTQPAERLSTDLQEVKSLLLEVRGLLREQRAPKEWYTTSEVAELLGKAEFAVREWCRPGRGRAEKKGRGRGKYQSWVISHAELQRLQKEGLLRPQKEA